MFQQRHSPLQAWPALVGLALLVMAAHLLALSGWAGLAIQPAGLAAQLRPRTILLLLPRPQARVDPAGPASPDQTQPTAAASPPQGSARPARGSAATKAGPGPDQVIPAAAAPEATAALGASLRGDTSTNAAAPAAATAVATAAALADAPPGGTDPADPSDTPAITPSASGVPPPLYPAQWPAAAVLRYAMHYYGHRGEAVLQWLPAGSSYQLQLSGVGQAPDGPSAASADSAAAARERRLIEQASQGQLDAYGLAPERFTDRRRGRSQRAANFRHALGRIEFSGPPHTHPAWLGAQDSLSWWVQLPAIAAAAAATHTALPEIRLFVVDARGGGETWRFENLGWVVLDGHLGPGPVELWRREPLQPEGQRIELWLDPARQHWPVQLRLSSLRSGGRFELRLLAIDNPAR